MQTSAHMEHVVSNVLCFKFAGLASIAVDFNKTGVPAVLPKDLICKSYLDFTENSTKPTHQPTKVLGKLCPLTKDMQYSSVHQILGNRFDKHLLFSGHEEYLDETRHLLEDHNSELYSIACKYEIWDEAELVSGFINKISRGMSRHEIGQHDAAQLVKAAVRKVRKRFAQYIWYGLDDDSESG
jgi:RNA-dependent RNA polymerase